MPLFLLLISPRALTLLERPHPLREMASEDCVLSLGSVAHIIQNLVLYNVCARKRINRVFYCALNARYQ